MDPALSLTVASDVETVKPRPTRATGRNRGCHTCAAFGHFENTARLASSIRKEAFDPQRLQRDIQSTAHRCARHVSRPFSRPRVHIPPRAIARCLGAAERRALTTAAACLPAAQRRARLPITTPDSNRIEADLLVLKWLAGGIVAGVISLVVRAFVRRTTSSGHDSEQSADCRPRQHQCG